MKNFKLIVDEKNDLIPNETNNTYCDKLNTIIDNKPCFLKIERQMYFIDQMCG